mmetsp:Transcript_53727/g.127047  ORF Transcript_53727/g.127047 Transcript_53727/m.127047 type:complete len:540 (+) Transcript_53727:1168-2787(+)
MVLLVDIKGNIEITEEILKKNFSQLTKNEKNPINFVSHFGTYDYGKNSVVETLIKNEKSWKENFETFSKIEKEIWAFETQTNDICLSFNGFDYSLDHFKRLKLLFNLSNSFFFHLNLNDIETFDSEWAHIIQFFFVLGIEERTRDNSMKTDMHFVVHDNYLGKKDFEIQKEIMEKIQNIWALSLEYLGQKKNPISFEIEESFSFFFHSISYKDLEKEKFSEDTEDLKQKIVNLNDNLEKFSERKFSNSPKELKEKIEKFWKESETLLFLPLLNREDTEIKGLINLYQTDILFNQLWQISNEVIKNWTTLVNRGKLVDNFGSIVSDFLSGLVLQFEKSLPEDFANDPRAIRKIQELSDMVRQQIISLFTRQILNLQTQALDKFKDLLLSIISDTKKDFEFEKKLVMEKINSWFEEKAEKIIVPEMQLTYQGARKELQNVLIEFAEKFKESPVVKLNSMQKVEKKTSSSGLKQSGIVIGFGLTTAVRPSGFGNFQLVTSYSHGPHVFNFSLVNDRDVAEQEGQGKIKPIRIQPSLNFDIDL